MASIVQPEDEATCVTAQNAFTVVVGPRCELKHASTDISPSKSVLSKVWMVRWMGTDAVSAAAGSGTPRNAITIPNTAPRNFFIVLLLLITTIIYIVLGS